jgi:hypothetical protein
MHTRRRIVLAALSTAVLVALAGCNEDITPNTAGVGAYSRGINNHGDVLVEEAMPRPQLPVLTIWNSVTKTRTPVPGWTQAADGIPIGLTDAGAVVTGMNTARVWTAATNQFTLLPNPAGALPGDQSTAFLVARDGLVFGIYGGHTGTIGPALMAWDSATMQVVKATSPPAGQFNYTISDASENGIVVGYFANPANTLTQLPFVWDAGLGQYESVTLPPGITGQALAVDSHDEVLIHLGLFSDPVSTTTAQYCLMGSPAPLTRARPACVPLPLWLNTLGRTAVGDKFVLQNDHVLYLGHWKVNLDTGSIITLDGSGAHIAATNAAGDVVGYTVPVANGPAHATFWPAQDHAG